MNGFFVSFEGIDGAGKSSHISAIKEALTANGYDVVMTREPGGTPLAEKLRSHILNDSMDTLTEALLAFAARRDHIHQVIQPAIERGSVVLCDRFTDSSVAYQGFGRQMENGQEIIGTLEKWVQSKNFGQMLQPNLTLWYDLDPAIAAERLKDARAPDRFESQMSDFFHRVRDGYQSRMDAQPERFVKINADQPRELVYSDVMEIVKNRILSLNHSPVLNQKRERELA